MDGTVPKCTPAQRAFSVIELSIHATFGVSWITSDHETPKRRR
jgi:hypothetical protein